MLARALNEAGIRRFRAYLERLRRGERGEPPRELLDDPAHSEELAADIAVEDIRFRNRLALGEHLCRMVERLPIEALEGAPGLWAWLSLYWFDQLCPVRGDGSRRPGRDYRHIPDFAYRLRNLHLLYGPYHVYRRHGPLSIVLLSGPVHADSHIYQAITMRQDLLANRGVIEAALQLYMDRKTGALKAGCQPSQPRPGTVRRFVRVLQQLDLTYDIYGMSGREILELLPPEFDPWRPAVARGGKQVAATLSEGSSATASSRRAAKAAE